MNNSKDQTIFVENYLYKLGFSKDQILLYLTLAKNGPLTILDAARKSGMERTKIYRMLDGLIDRKIIEEIPEYKKRSIKAADVNTFELLVKEKELDDKYLANSLPFFSSKLREISKSTPESNVIYYQGVEGIRQMTWNMLSCKGLFRTYSYRFWEDLLGASFVLKLNEELVRRKFKVHDLYSDEYLEYKEKFMKIHKKKPEGEWNFWHSKYISEKLLKINQNIDIYNDVVSYYYWQGDETFGVEIHNARVAHFQKQIHDHLWTLGKTRGQLDWRREW